jgi:hypothetical protein
MSDTRVRSALWEEMLALRPAIAEAHAKANREALLEHARMGRSVSTMRDGQVVWITPAEIFARYGLDEFGREKPGESRV